MADRKDKGLPVCSIFGIHPHSNRDVVFHVWNGHSSIHRYRPAAHPGGFSGCGYRITVGQSATQTGIKQDHLYNASGHQPEFYYPLHHPKAVKNILILRYVIFNGWEV